MSIAERARQIRDRNRGGVGAGPSLLTGRHSRLGPGYTHVLVDDSTYDDQPDPKMDQIELNVAGAPSEERLAISSQGLSVRARQARFGWDPHAETFGGGLILNPMLKFLPIGYPFSFMMFMQKPPDVMTVLKSLPEVLDATN